MSEPEKQTTQIPRLGTGYFCHKPWQTFSLARLKINFTSPKLDWLALTNFRLSSPKG